jgi:hypothetical protein
MDIAISKNGIPIRLTEERWLHISLGHPEVADYYYEILDTIEEPEIIYKGNYGSLIAVGLKHEVSGKYLVVIYKETSQTDGFILTAYISNKLNPFIKKTILWKPSQ